MISTSKDGNEDFHKNTSSRLQKATYCATLKNDCSNTAGQQLTLLQIFDNNVFWTPLLMS